MTPDLEAIVSGLSERQKMAVVNCEREGNGAHIWSIFPLMRLGLMDLVPVPRLQGVPAYRLNETGLAIRSLLQKEQNP